MIDDADKHRKNDWGLGSSYRNFETAMLDILSTETYLVSQR